MTKGPMDGRRSMNGIVSILIAAQPAPVSGFTAILFRLRDLGSHQGAKAEC